MTINNFVQLYELYYGVIYYLRLYEYICICIGTNVQLN